MKKVIALLVAACAIVALWLLMATERQSPSTKSQTGAQHVPRDPASEEKKRYEEAIEKKEKRSEEALKHIIESENVPIELWGKVVDQNGGPISGASIKYHIRQPKRMWHSDIVEREIKSDTNGNFHISGEKGDVLSIDSITAAGYRQVKGQKAGFNYRRSYRSDRTKPEVYTLIKEKDLPNLISAERWTSLPWDGEPIHYDLRTGRYGQKGEIKITAMRGEVQGTGRQARFDWLFRVEVPGGGVLEATQGNAFIAPEGGYKPIWEFSRNSTDKKWSYGKGGDTHLLFRLQDGNYARMKVNFTAEIGNPYSCDITSYLNPSGGRILEYDSSRRINNKR